MATPRGAEHRDLEQRIRNLEAQLREVSSRVLSQRKLEVSEGDFVVKGGGNIVILGNDGSRVWDALSGPIKATGGKWDNDNAGITSTSATFGGPNFTVPAGYTSAVVTCWASAGATFTNGGSIGVVTVTNGVDGPNIANGAGGTNVACSASSLQNIILTGLTPGGVVQLRCRAATNVGGAVQAGSTNIHISGSALFLR